MGRRARGASLAEEKIRTLMPRSARGRDLPMPSGSRVPGAGASSCGCVRVPGGSTSTPFLGDGGYPIQVAAELRWMRPDTSEASSPWSSWRRSSRPSTSRRCQRGSARSGPGGRRVRGRVRRHARLALAHRLGPVDPAGMASGTADLQRDLDGAIRRSILGALLTAGCAAAVGTAIANAPSAGQTQITDGIASELRNSFASAEAVAAVPGPLTIGPAGLPSGYCACPSPPRSRQGGAAGRTCRRASRSPGGGV